MTRGVQAVGGQHEVHAGLADLLAEFQDALVAVRLGHVADVHGEHTARVAVHDLGVDFRVLLAAVADQHELQVGEALEDLFDHAVLVPAVPAEQVHAPVAQEQRAQRNAAVVEELPQQVEEVPGAAGHVEDRVAGLAVAGQGAVQGAHAGERQAGAGVAGQDGAEHARHAGHVRLDDRVVQVADHAEAGVRDDLHAGAGLHLAPVELQRHLMPPAGQRAGRRELQREVPVAVTDCSGPLAVQDAADGHAAHLAGEQAAQDVLRVAQSGVGAARGRDGAGQQHPAAQFHAARGAPAHVRLEQQLPARPAGLHVPAEGAVGGQRAALQQGQQGLESGLEHPPSLSGPPGPGARGSFALR